VIFDLNAELCVERTNYEHNTVHVTFILCLILQES